MSKEEARQEPVAWLAQNKSGNIRFTESKSAAQELEGYGWKVTPLYTHPAPVNQQLLEALRLAEDSLAAFVSDHGWSQQDMDNLDTVTAAIAQAEKGMK